jgi:hypothetical protein
MEKPNGKLIFYGDEVPITFPPLYNNFIPLLQEILGLDDDFMSSIKLSYRDNDEDKIQVSSEEEYKIFMDEIQKGKEMVMTIEVKEESKLDIKSCTSSILNYVEKKSGNINNLSEQIKNQEQNIDNDKDLDLNENMNNNIIMENNIQPKKDDNININIQNPLQPNKNVQVPIKSKKNQNLFPVAQNNNNNINNFNNEINNNNNINNINNFNKMNFYYYKEKTGGGEYANPNSGFPSAAPTAPSSMERTSSLYSILSNSSGSFFGQSDNEYYGYNNNKNTSQEKYEKKLELNIDIKRILSLEDRRTTLMIKNIPNKFKRDLLLKIINENFKGAYDLFILPTDANGYKNFGYSFINFTSSYYIPYFYYLFDHKKWSSTNSQKICEITYSKIQGRNNLLSHYPNKIIYRNNEVKKIDNDNKYIIPNDYNKIFNSIYPNYIVEKHATYFITKMPFRY